MMKAEKLDMVIGSVRQQIATLDEDGFHLAAAKLSQALDVIESDRAALQTPSSD
jgi:hypothetical protein